MRRQESDLRLLCCVSIIALSLGACSHQGGKLARNGNLTDNPEAASTVGERQLHSAASSRTGDRWLRKKSHSVASRSSQYDNLWDRLFDLYDLPPIEHEEIDRELAWFINHPAYIERVQERAEPFLYSIVKQVEKHDIPGEIALLPVIESAFQPHAVSPANAAGIWQFIPSTGRLYGLKRSYTYDGRRDVYASTKAAIKYLKKLHRDFDGDWLLAIAAYNCGEGAVSRAIERNLAHGLPTDFWSLDLPQETRSYVPRLLAVAKLFVSADQYGVTLHEIPNSARFKPVKVTTPYFDLAVAADAANMPLEQLYALNPGFKGKYSDLEGSTHLFIPAKTKAAEFRKELERLSLAGRASTDSSVATLDINEQDTRMESWEEPRETVPTARDESFGSAPRRSDRTKSESHSPSEGALGGPRLAMARPVPQPASEARYAVIRRTADRTSETVPGGETLDRTSGAISSRIRNAPDRGNDGGFAVLFKARDNAGNSGSPKIRNVSDRTGEADEAVPTLAREVPERRYIPASVLIREAMDRTSDFEIQAVEEVPDRPTTREPSGQRKTTPAHPPSKVAASRVEPKVAATKAQYASEPAPDHPGKKTAHTVLHGETLYAVARKYNVDVKQLAQWNGIPVNTKVQAGQNLVVWNKDTAKKLPPVGSGIRPSQSIHYTVKAGDTLFSISRRFKVSLSDLRRWNGSNVERRIQPGRNIMLTKDDD